MKKGSQPLRQCVVCRNGKLKEELFRVVKSKDGAIAIDMSGKLPGRGAYICRQGECARQAFAKKALNKAMKCNVPSQIYEELLSRTGEE